MSAGVCGATDLTSPGTQGFYVCVLTGFPVESKEVGTVNGPISQKGKLRPGELEEVAQDHRARQWQSQEKGADSLTPAMRFPLETQPDVAERALDRGEAIIPEHTPRNLSRLLRPPDLRLPEHGPWRPVCRSAFPSPGRSPGPLSTRLKGWSLLSSTTP